MVGASINTVPADGHPGSAIVCGCANVLRSVLARTKRTVRWPAQTAMASRGGSSVSIARGHWISCFRQPLMTRNHYRKPGLVGGASFVRGAHLIIPAMTRLFHTGERPPTSSMLRSGVPLAWPIALSHSQVRHPGHRRFPGANRQPYRILVYGYAHRGVFDISII